MNAHPPSHDPKATFLQSLDRAVAWHKDLRATIARLDAAFTQWQVSPRLAAPWRHFTEGIDDHLKIEEEILFPALRALAEGQDPGHAEFEGPLQEMQFELDELATISDALRNASPEAGELENDLLTMLDQLDVHADKEQNVIFPEGARLLAAWKTAVRAPAPVPAPAAPVAAPTPAPAPASTPAPQPAPPPPEDEHGVLFRVFRRLARRLS